MAPPLGSHPFSVLLWELPSVDLPIHCEAHIFPQVPGREAPPACSGEADVSQIKTPLSLSLRCNRQPLPLPSEEGGGVQGGR